MNEKLQKTLEFFKAENIELPTDVKNALEDVFSENDNINDVDIYFKDDIDILEGDLILTNEVNAYLTKPSAGSVNNTFTYFGDVDYSLSELVNLYDDNDNLLVDITNINNQQAPSKINPDSYAIILVENVAWNEGTLEKKPKLFIYCPQKSSEIEEGGE